MALDINLLANALVHIIILLGFWVIVYRFFAFDIGRNAFRDQLKNAIENVAKPLRTKNEGWYTTQTADVANGVAGDIAHRYSALTPGSRAINNQALLDIVYIIIALALSLTLLPRFTDNPIDWTHILKENAITYIFVGIVELIFFTQIAKNYAPILPSQLGSNTKVAVAHNLSC